MEPTLVVGDRYIAWKKYYRTHEPRHGDLAIFKHPLDNREDVIKRIVGLPGDRIQVIGGVLNINGESVKRERVEDSINRNSRGVPQYRETRPNGRSYLIKEQRGDTGPLDNTVEYVVPPGANFSLGDNRDNSADSRHGGWFVPRGNLIGYPIFIFWSGGWLWSEEWRRMGWRRMGSQVQPLP